MRRPCLLAAPLAVLLCLMLACARAQEPPQTALGLGPVTHFTLANGLQVLVAPSSDASLVTVDVWVAAGTRFETAATNGAAHFIEHLIFKGTPTRKPGEIDAAIEDLGGTLNAATSYDWAHFYVTVGASDAPAALSVLSDAVMHASLRQADMDTERQVILSERARELANPAQRTVQEAEALMFPNHAYGRSLLGSPDQITNMTRQTVTDFYHARYVPGNVTLVLSGRITPQTGRILAQKAFNAWPASFISSRSLPASPPVEPQTEIRTETLTGSATQAYLTLGWRAPSVFDKPDAWVMDVLLTYLGQGANNKLDTDLRRNAKIVSTVAANYLTQHDPGVLTITASFSPGQLDSVRAGILAHIQALRDTPLAPADLSAARRTLLASYLFDTETNSGRANALGFYSIIDTYRYDTDYIPHVLSVTSQQVQAAARKYLDPNIYTQVTLLPRANPILASGAP